MNAFVQVSVPVQTGPSRANPVISNLIDSSGAARALAGGGMIGHGFANFYAITARADRASVERVNLMKGRPADQVGSITVPPSGIGELFDWGRLPAGLTRRAVLGVIDTFYGLGPFGFRGPAAAHLPQHLTFRDHGIVTAQVIAPGYACPCNDFLARCLDATGEDLLYITSANRSRQLTGADDTPAHWRAAELRAEFGPESGFAMLEHADETAARASYPRYLPMSTSILGFHQLGTDPSDRRPQLVLDRHGSLHADDVRQVLDRLGFGLAIGPRANTRLSLREYVDRP
jgi:tRNA A37 threonylcarbamoyladenosine synthetase subunit TsaC/SUA5/YrdC